MGSEMCIRDRYGGAIYNRYISNEDLKFNADCFLRYSEPFVEPLEWEVQFNFSGNKANLAGCSIYSSSVLPCSWSEHYLVNISTVFRWNENWHYENQKCENGEIYTEPHNFSLHNQSLTDPITFFPGNTFSLPLEAWDDFEQDVTGSTVYSASLLDSNPQAVAEIDPGYIYVTSNFIRITGKPGNNISIVLQTDSPRTVHVVLNMTLLMCPPGFVLSQGSGSSENIKSIGAAVKESKCDCPDGSKQYRHKLKCNFEQFQSKIDVNYWYGPLNIKESGGNISTPYLMGMAPFAYRFMSQDMEHVLNNTSIHLPGNRDKIEETLCGNVSRRGVLCGECVEGYAVAVNSPTYECVPCDGNSTTLAGEFIKHLCAYIALTYVPITIVFIAIIFFNIKLASSAAAGFVLYAQIVSSGYFDITGYSMLTFGARNNAPLVVQSIYTTIYGILNLESFAFLIRPFCLNKNFTTLHILCLDYVIAAFPLVVIVTIYLAYRIRCNSLYCCCQRRQQPTVYFDSDPSSTTVTASEQLQCNKTPKNTLIHALTAFMLLSYTKFSLASIRTVVLGVLFDDTGNAMTHRIYLAGHLSFSDRDFLFPFGILAILVLVFIVFLPPLLLLGPLQFMDWLVDKPGFSCLRRYWPSITIHTFLDTFQGYKPNRRFFGGLYLLFRLSMFLTYSFSQDLLTQYAIQQIVILCFVALVSLLKPYSNNFYNFLDTLLFLNLGILNALAIYTTDHSYSAGVYAFECILVFLPLVYMTCYVIWNRVHKRKHYKTIKENFTRHLVNPVRASRTEVSRPEESSRDQLLKSDDNYPFGESIDYSSDDPDEDIFQRATRRNRFRVANIQTHPPRRAGEVPKTVVSILDPQLLETEEEENVSKQHTSDSGIGRQSSSGGSDTKGTEY